MAEGTGGKKAKVRVLKAAQIDLNEIPDGLKTYLEIEFPGLNVSDLHTLVVRCLCPIRNKTCPRPNCLGGTAKKT